MNKLMEDHRLVFVAAKSEKEARVLAKKKWKVGTLHVDGTQKLVQVDGYRVLLEKKGKAGDGFSINPSYSK